MISDLALFCSWIQIQSLYMRWLEWIWILDFNSGGYSDQIYATLFCFPFQAEIKNELNLNPIKVSRFFWFMVYFCLSWIRKILRNMKSLKASAQQPICQMLSDHFRQKKILATTKWLNKVNLWEFECRQSCFWKKKFFVCQMWWFQKHSYRGLLFRLNWLMKIFWWNWI